MLNAGAGNQSMSVQFGKCNFDDEPVNPKDLDLVRPLLAPYGPDDEGYYCHGNTAVLYRAFHTTKESRLESQPYVSPRGNIITWDGRLDNRNILIEEFSDELTDAATDLSIVAAAYEKWGTKSFGRLVGDWALSVWDPNARCLILARDFIGGRHLYYSRVDNTVRWSTILDPLVLIGEASLALNEEYLAGWLSYFPAAHLTPYHHIHAVPPSCFVDFRPGTSVTQKYWDFDPARTIRYATDEGYEQHFRAVFGDAVRRRLRSDTPIIAELSGGMDSSSVVCMADTVAASGKQIQAVDTVSYYDDSERNWDERTYFQKVEEARGRTGYHVDVSAQQELDFSLETDHFIATPASWCGVTKAAKTLTTYIESRGYRVLLSGIGGDEVMGGVPSVTPELMDLIARARFSNLAHGLKLWALDKRKPLFRLLVEAVLPFLPSSITGGRNPIGPAPWIQADFAKRNKLVFQGYASRVRLFGPRPSFQENLAVVASLRRQLSCDMLQPVPNCERRYPYLDRTLLEFMYALPREQVVRPRQRRSLMRRALQGIVPDLVLSRSRKAYATRLPATVIAKTWAELAEFNEPLLSGQLGIIEPKIISEILANSRQGQQVALVTLIRTLSLEAWLRHLDQRVGINGRTSRARCTAKAGT